MRRAVRPALLVLAVCVVLDALVLSGHVAHLRGVEGFGGRMWDLDLDTTWVELLRGAQVLAAAALLVRLGRRLPAATVLVLWSGVLVVGVLDDLARLHERVGGRLALLGAPALPGLRPEDTGELIFWLGAAVVLGVPLLLAHRRAEADVRRVSWTVAAGVALLASFGAGVDMLHIALREALDADSDVVFTLAESIGETLAAGLLLAAVVLWSVLLTGRRGREGGRHDGAGRDAGRAAAVAGVTDA